MLVACGLRHILQHTQSLPNSPLPVGRHLLPFRKHFILDVALLLRCELSPSSRVVSNLLLFLRRQAIELLEVLPLFRAQILKTLRLRLGIVYIRGAIWIEIRLCGFVAGVGRTIPADHAHRIRLAVLRLAVRRSIAWPVVVWPIVVSPTIFLLLLTAFLTRRLRLLLRLLRRPVVLLCRARQRQQRDACRCQKPFHELDSPLHFTLYLSYLSTITSGDSSGRHRRPAPAAAILSARQNSKAHRDFPTPEYRLARSAADCWGVSPPKPLPVPASPQQSPHGVPGTRPTSSASPATPPRVRARANQTPATVRLPATHRANCSLREIHSRADGTRRKWRGASPPRTARFPSSVRPRTPEFCFPSGCNS